MVGQARAEVDDVDAVFRALADPTRRRVLEQLGRAPAPVSALAAEHAMALPSFVAHLRVLEACGLVRSTKTGRVRTYALAPERLKIVETWLDAQRVRWEARLDRLDDYLLRMGDNDA